MHTICTRKNKNKKMTREYFFIIRPKYIFEMVLKKKKDTHLRVSSPIPAGRSQTRLLGQKSLLRKSLRAIKEVRKQKMQSPSNPSEPQKPLNFHRGFQEWDLVKAESWKHLEAQCQRWSQWSHQGPPWPDPSLPLYSSCTGHSGAGPSLCPVSHQAGELPAQCEREV